MVVGHAVTAAGRMDIPPYGIRYPLPLQARGLPEHILASVGVRLAWKQERRNNSTNVSHSW